MTGQIAIIGAGPSGCFLAQALLKAQPDLRVDLIDRLPVPYGLVRYGVAADHQGTKGVTRQFARLFERQGAVCGMAPLVLRARPHHWKRGLQMRLWTIALPL